MLPMAARALSLSPDAFSFDPVSGIPEALHRERVAPAQGRAARAPEGQSGLALALESVGKRFGDNEVRQGIDLHIAGGAFVAVVGRSGCGKSTLLRLLVGLDEPSAGRIRAPDGATRTQTRRIMFQEPRLLPWARVIDN